MAEGLAKKVALGQEAGLLTGLHALVVRQGQNAILDHYASGPDWAWGQDLGVVDHGPDTLHDLRSVTKSIVSLLYGIALEAGLVPDLETPLFEVFSDYPDLFQEDQARAMRVKHALHMTLGLEWNEDLPYSDPRNSEIAMEYADDRYRFILSQPRQSAAGAAFLYSGGATALVGAVIERAVGQKLGAFASEALFAPLGITDVFWHEGSDGTQSPASGLRLTAPDLAKVGQLLLQNGAWSGAQIVPASWITKLQTPVTSTPFGADYALSWYGLKEYVPATGHMEPVMAALGNGGQRLYVIPSLDLTVALFAGNYNFPDQWLTPTLILRRLILEHVRV